MRHLFLSVLIGWMGCASQEPNISPMPLGATYAVYVTVLDSMQSTNGPPLVADRTRPSPTADSISRQASKFIREGFPLLDSVTWSNYARANAQRHPIHARQVPRASGVVKTDSAIQSFLADWERKSRMPAWRRVFMGAPEASEYVLFSAVGFNADSTQAFVHASSHFPDGFGAGSYFLLRRTEEQWQIVAEQMSWIN